MSSAHIHKTGSRMFLLAMGIVIVLGTLSPASTDVNAKNASVPYINGLVNPAYAGLPMSAREVPQKRSEKATVFQIGTDKYAAISFASPMFTDVNRKWLPIDQSGRREGDSYIFDRLAEGVDISFDLTKPQYTLTQNGQGFTVAFSASATGRIIDERSIAYTLADGAILTWTVNGNHVHKEILMEKKDIAENIAFTITPTKSLKLRQENHELSLVNSGNKTVFSFDAPFLAQADGMKLSNAITLQKSGAQYRYVFDESGLSLPYVIDPSVGPQNPTAAVSTPIGACNTWTSATNVYADDGVYATNTVNQTFLCTYYLDVTGFDFSAVPSGATIDGIVAEFDRKVSATGKSPQDQTVQLLLASVASGTNYAVAANWPTTEAYASYGTGTTDKWGLTPSDTDVKNSGFGLRIQVHTLTSGIGQPTFSVDHVRMTVYYTESGGGGDPVPALSFTSGGLALAGFLWQRRRTKPVLHSSPS